MSQATPREERLKRLTHLSRGFTYAASASEILRSAAEQAAVLLEAEKAILLLVDTEGLLRVQASFGVSDDVISRFRASFDESLASRLQGLLGSAEGFLGVPLVAKGRVTGLLAVMRKPGVEHRDDDEWLLSALADQMAAPLENAQLAAKLQHAALLVENARLYEGEREARREAQLARAEAEAARAEAEAANHAKSQFIAGMSHELRTPLNAIAGYVELFEMGVRGAVTDAQREDLRRIRQNQRVVIDLINDILNFAKLEGGHVRFEMGNVPVHETLIAMEALVMPQLISRALRYAYTPTDPRLTVWADREKLQQIVVNLLANAVKYTAAQGEIALSVTEMADAVLIHVRDSGRGIAAAQLEQIFVPFVRADTARATEGTGLGLAISRNLARTMRGELTAESALGKGSTFTLRLPKRAPG
ncbi:MAG TPA: GAF domain-containing sensor histidine kinase [Gemmatimonadaceae bacterium]|jgi:signal transduction histidine kinase